MELTHAYIGGIVKTEKTDDGLIVLGKATGPDLDIDEQRCDPAWLAKAVPAWAVWGNVREQHTAIAAGVGLETVADGEDWHVKSLVVDPVTARKVEAGVLKGYSIGIKNARVVKDATAPGGRIVGGDIVEISLVDRPANPTCTVDIAKAAGASSELRPVSVTPEPDGTKAAVPASAHTPAETAEPAPAALVPSLHRTAARAALERTAAADVSKAAEHDPAALQTIRQGLVDCIKTELDELAAGEDELWDISRLLCAVRDFCGWWNSEAADGEVAAPATTPEDDGDDMDYVLLGVSADIVKAAKADGAPDEARQTFRAEVRKALGVDSAESDAKVEELTKQVATLGEQLEKVLASPVVGGPARTRGQEQASKSAQTAKLEQRIAYLDNMASQATDITLQAGYREMHKQALADLRALA